MGPIQDGFEYVVYSKIASADAASGSHIDPYATPCRTPLRLFWAYRQDSDNAAGLLPRHSHGMPCLQCELPNLLQESMPPDPELVDLIEQAFIEGQIDGLTPDLAYLWLQANKG